VHSGLMAWTDLSFSKKTMRIALSFFLVALPALAQEKADTAAAPPACGPDDTKFDVKLDETQHTLAQPEPGKARVYFIEDKGAHSFGIGAAVETWVGLDGEWAGANRNNSYFSVSVGPGEHHVCASVRSIMGHALELAHFIAQTGEVYYFRARIIPTPYGLYLFFNPVDSEQARFLVGSSPLSVSHAKK
jgi:hypothetical protein